MPEQFMRRHEVDIAMIHEVTSKKHIEVTGYHTIENIGTAGRGTAMIIREDLKLDRIKRIRSRRGITAYYKNICLIYIYAPSGTNNRTEREIFFNKDVIELLPQNPTETIMAGDFNCVQTDEDCTGHRYSIKALEKLTRGLQLEDEWDTTLNATAYTHYIPTSAARLDRIYATDHVRKGKQGIQTPVAAFTDHLAVLFRVKMEIPFILRGRGRWFMKNA